MFIPLGHTHVFVGNVRASVRADEAHEVIHIKDSKKLAEQFWEGMTAFVKDPANSKPDHTKFKCTEEQGAKLKEVVKKRITQIVESAYPDGLGWMQHPESQGIKQYAASACFQTSRLFEKSEAQQDEFEESSTTGAYIVQAIYELMYCNVQDASPAYGFVAQPGEEPYWLDKIDEEGVPAQSLRDFGFDDPYTAPMPPLELELDFIWHETKSEWVTRSEYRQDPPARKKSVRFSTLPLR